MGLTNQKGKSWLAQCRLYADETTHADEEITVRLISAWCERIRPSLSADADPFRAVLVELAAFYHNNGGDIDNAADPLVRTERRISLTVKNEVGGLQEMLMQELATVKNMLSRGVVQVRLDTNASHEEDFEEEESAGELPDAWAERFVNMQGDQWTGGV